MSGKDKRWKHLSAKPPWRWDVPGSLIPEDCLKTTSLIGYRCTISNDFSLVLLICREAWPPFSSSPAARRTSKKKLCLHSLSGFSDRFFPWRVLPLSSNIFFLHLFPVSIAGLQLTFPSRTRSIRGPAAMVLHIWLRESSSMPDFFFKDSADFQQGLFLSFFKEKRLDYSVRERKRKG